MMIILVFVVAAAVVGWVAGGQIKSPAQVAAETEPPEPSVIAVPVERTVISNDVITRGTVRFEDPEPIAATSVVLPGVDPVLTRMPEVGEAFGEGDVLYEIAGRPTFLLQGDLPLFRTASRGDEGEDIAQLQRALRRLGFYDGEIDGEYGRTMEAAVVAFYEAKGYEAYKPRGSSRHPLVQSEFVFHDTLPIRVDAVTAHRGDLVAGEIMRVSGSRLAIDASVDVDDAEFVEVGAEVEIDHQQLGISTTGIVAFKADRAGTNDVDVDKVYIEIVPQDQFSELNLVNVRITIPVTARSTEGEVLAVPAAALSATGAGETVVTVLEGDETTRSVTVTTGLATASGLVEVIPIDGELIEGDLVVVGYEQGES